MEQEHILNTHIDTLKEWWENADVEGIVHAGDTIIKKGRAGYVIYTAWPHEDGEDVTMWKYEQDPPGADYRILARAPKPKPAWHDAVAVIAHHEMRSTRQVWYTRPDAVVWYSTTTGDEIQTGDMINPVPLIEAKVTDEMVKRLENHFLDSANMALPTGLARTMLTAALGLGTA